MPLARALDRIPPLVRALDRIQCGVLVTSCSMQPSFINSYARQVLDRGEALELSNGRLRAHTAEDHRTLTTLVSRAANGEMDRAVTVWMRSSDPAKRLALHVVGDAGRTAHREALLFVCDPSHTVVVDQASMRSLYGFTRAEAAFAGLLLRGKSVEEAADLLCISIHTARTHLKRLLMKADTGRQSELLRVLLTCSGFVRLD